MVRVYQGDSVRNTVAIKKRDAFFSRKGLSGKTRIDIPANTILEAATNELGGNIYVRAFVPAGAPKEGEGVLVPLAEGEWVPA